MITGKIAGAVLKLLLPKVTDHLMKVFKMNKLLNYMELPNEADKKIEKLEANIQVLLENVKEFEVIKDDINKIKKLGAFKSIGK